MDSPAQLSQLRILQRQYFQLVEPNQLRWPDDATLKKPEVQSWLFTNLFDPAKVTSPPPDRYQLRFLKELVSKLERSITDPEEDVRSPISSSSFLLLLLPAMYDIKVDSLYRKQFVPAFADLRLLSLYRKSQMILWNP